MGGPNIVRIVTLNTWKNDGDLRRRLPAMASGLRALAPDIVLLQEVFRADEPRWHTAEQLADEVGLACVYAPARRKQRAWEGRTLECEAGLAILWRGGRPETGTLALPSSEIGGERLVLFGMGRIRDARVIAGNVHLSHVRGDELGRRRQLLTTLEHPAWRMPADLRVLGGDFNAKETSGVFAAPPDGAAGLRNVFNGALRCAPTHPLPPRKDRVGRTIDFLFTVASAGEAHPAVARAFTALDAPGEAGVWPSDHAAVAADLCVSSASTA